jgi:L-2-hydroxycarboxylate dehydrogenase (NAD+)
MSRKISDHYIIDTKWHYELALSAFRIRGYEREEAQDMAKLCEEAARNGIRTHNLIKALHLDHLFGACVGGCVPGAKIEKINSKFSAVEKWNANRKTGPSVAWNAIDKCIELADKFGVGTVVVNNAWHYLWGGAYVLEAAKRGYIGYTNCTAMLAEVAPFGGKSPTMGTNPHSWAFPTVESLGFPVLVDWATSSIAMGRVQQLKREGKLLPPMSALDQDGNMTQEPDSVRALLPFGLHKGYGLGLLDELYAGWIGGSLPTLRGRYGNIIPEGEKQTCCFYFQVIHPEAISAEHFAQGRTSQENVKRIVEDILSNGNESCTLPGENEAKMALRSKHAKGLLFSFKEIEELNKLAKEAQFEQVDIKNLEQEII